MCRCPQAGLFALAGFLAVAAALGLDDVIIRWTHSTTEVTCSGLRLGLAFAGVLFPLDLDLAVSWCGAVRHGPSVPVRASAMRFS